MLPPTTSELLDIWESGLRKPLLDKTIHLLHLASPGSNSNDIANLNIGERDRRLFQLREWMFGSRLLNIALCPECNQQVEWESNLKDLLSKHIEPGYSPNQLHFSGDGFHIYFRLPNTRDIIIAINDKSYQLQPRKLLSRLIFSVACDQGHCTIDDLPDNIVEALGQYMEKEDPDADIRILLNCPQCRHNWESNFDIVSYLWTEIESWAIHLLREVYQLAKAFSWTEKEILNLSHQRRQFYLEMIRS